jgi:hypothetical protein
LLRERSERYEQRLSCVGSPSPTARHKVFLSARACARR